MNISQSGVKGRKEERKGYLCPRERERGREKILLATTKNECIGKRAKSILLGGRMMASSYLCTLDR